LEGAAPAPLASATWAAPATRTAPARQAEIVSFIAVSPLRARLCRHKTGTAYDRFPISGRAIVAVWEEMSVAKSLEKSLDVYS
jgi:hypothetical protein